MHIHNCHGFLVNSTFCHDIKILLIFNISLWLYEVIIFDVNMLLHVSGRAFTGIYFFPGFYLFKESFMKNIEWIWIFIVSNHVLIGELILYLNNWYFHLLLFFAFIGPSFSFEIIFFPYNFLFSTGLKLSLDLLLLSLEIFTCIIFPCQSLKSINIYVLLKALYNA